MLARLEAHEAVSAAYLSVDGERVLLRGRAGADRAALLAACETALRGTQRRAAPLPPQQAQEAWAARADERAWLARGRLWRLSWREAERFADRLLAALRERFGEQVDPLRPVLVEAFFEEVRPRDGGGPAPSRWPPGAPREQRREAVLTEARRHLPPAQVQDLAAFLADEAAVRDITRASGASQGE